MQGMLLTINWNTHKCLMKNSHIDVSLILGINIKTACHASEFPRMTRFIDYWHGLYYVIKYYLKLFKMESD